MALTEQKLYSLKQDLIKLIQANQFKKAEKLYPRIKDKNLRDVELWKIFAHIHSQRGNFAETVYCCKNILRVKPDDFLTIFNLAVAFQNLSRIDEAIDQYEKCISIDPNYINAYANSAQLYYVKGDFERSVIYYRRTLENIDTLELRINYSQSLMSMSDYENAIKQLSYVLDKQPEDKRTLFITAQCFYELQNYSKAEKYYLTLYKTDDQDIKVINNLGRLYEETGSIEKAIKMFQEALDIDESNSIIHLNLGKVYVKSGDFDKAIQSFLRSIELKPEHPEPYFNLGKLYNEKGDIDQASNVLKKALDLDIQRYMEKPDEFRLAVKYFLSNIDSPDSFDDDKKAFVADLFDGYADKFDQHLVEGLQYKTPEIIDEMIAIHVSQNTNRTLDLGCGTGLCCQYLRPRSITVSGIDLSEKMVDKARELNCYDHLYVGEITEIVSDLDENFDLVVAADVFVYIGSLKDIFIACSTKMSKGSYFIFSTELLSDQDENDFRLYDSGRYKHSSRYIEKLTEETGFELVQQRHCTLRKENGKDVSGSVTVLKKTSTSD